MATATAVKPGSKRVVIAGEPGETWTNDTTKVQYQLKANWRNSCAVCIQFDRQIGPLWPTPFHRNCSCTQGAVYPGKTSEPFVDFRDKIRELEPAEQTRVMGRSTFVLVETGVVKWDDVVTTGRIRSLREVVARNKLDVETMVKAGVMRRHAAKAYEDVNTPAHRIVAEERKQALKHLEELVGQEVARRRAAERLAKRVATTTDPGFRQPKPVAPGLAGILLDLGVKPSAVEAAIGFGESKATVVAAGGDDARHDAYVRELFGRDVRRAELASLVGAPDDATVTLNANFGPNDLWIGWTSSKGEGISRIQERDGDLVLTNRYVEVWEHERGKGVGAAIFGRQVEAAGKAGVARIELTAARDDVEGLVGHAVWPKLGFDAELPDETRRRLPRALNEAQRLSDLMTTQAGRDWWQAHGDTIDATFDLAPDSLSQRVWKGYLAAKATAPPRAPDPTSTATTR